MMDESDTTPNHSNRDGLAGDALPATPWSKLIQVGQGETSAGQEFERTALRWPLLLPW